MLRRTALKLLSASPFAISAARPTVSGPPADGWMVGAGETMAGQLPAANEAAPSTLFDVHHKAAARWLRGNKDYLAELRDRINAEIRVVCIDPDLMAMKSLSNAARIYYMRQRLVERQMRSHLEEDESIWKVNERWIVVAKRALGLLM